MEKLKHLPFWGVYALLAYMPFHVFLSQWLSTLTGGLAAWKVAKDVLTMGLVVLTFGLVLKAQVYRHTSYVLLAGASVLYTLLHIGLYLVNKDTSLGVAALATVYNSRLFWYVLIGMGAALLLPKQLDYRRLVKLMLVVSTIVACFGLLQYVLPKDIMTHFGYSLERGVRPAFFIDDKPDLPRIMSTIRDPNSLGAYLILPITVLWTYLLTNKKKSRVQLLIGLLGVHFLALFLTFSRGSAAGTVLSLVTVTIYLRQDVLLKLLKKFWLVAVVCTVLVLSGMFALRDQYVIQNIIFHSDESTISALDSNEYHLSFAEKGLKGVVDKPLGHGPGTAGIVSIQNPQGGLLTENYFIQIGYEVGFMGLMLFVAILVFVQKKLWLHQSNLATALWASFWGYLLMGMLFHVWTNEAIAAQWWLLTGIMLGLPAATLKKL